MLVYWIWYRWWRCVFKLCFLVYFKFYDSIEFEFQKIVYTKGSLLMTYLYTKMNSPKIRLLVSGHHLQLETLKRMSGNTKLKALKTCTQSDWHSERLPNISKTFRGGRLGEGASFESPSDVCNKALATAKNVLVSLSYSGNCFITLTVFNLKFFF